MPVPSLVLSTLQLLKRGLAGTDEIASTPNSLQPHPDPGSLPGVSTFLWLDPCLYLDQHWSTGRRSIDCDWTMFGQELVWSLCLRRNAPKTHSMFLPLNFALRY